MGQEEDVNEIIEDIPANATPPEPHPGKKRLRRDSTWKCNKKKKLRNTGQSYIDRKMNLHKAKKLREYNHQCRFHCNTNITHEQREAIFKDYWKLGSWELQTSFLNGSVEIQPIKRRKATAVSNKSLSCYYILAGFRVCKTFFLKTLDISNKRIRNVIIKKNGNQSGISPRDKRGKKEPPNKIPAERVEIVMEHIRKFPNYSSHYSRARAPNKRYLCPNLNLSKMYKLYETFCREEKNVEPEKESFYRLIFNTKFNLSFHRPHTDTCVTCDKLQIKIEHGLPEERKSAEIEKEVHLRKAEAVKQSKEKCKNLKDDNKVTICFDLQKMMPTPHLTNSKCYYMRQLWTYNLNIHNLTKGTAHMFMWHEGQAGRGCQEIASCLLKFIKSLPSTVTHISAFSDNCGGQNKSHLIVKFWLYIIRNTHVETVDHHFLIAGHSYNECDQDFGIIELKKKKYQRDVYVPEDWITLAVSASRKFIVTKMVDEDFIDLKLLDHYFRKSVPGIRGMQLLHYDKAHPNTLFFKNSSPEGILPYQELPMKKQRVGKVPNQLPTLKMTDEKQQLKEKKYRDLMELLQFVPPIYHDFYRNLPHETKTGEPQPSTSDDHEDDVSIAIGNQIYDTDEDN